MRFCSYWMALKTFPRNSHIYMSSYMVWFHSGISPRIFPQNFGEISREIPRKFCTVNFQRPFKTSSIVCLNWDVRSMKTTFKCFIRGVNLLSDYEFEYVIWMTTWNYCICKMFDCHILWQRCENDLPYSLL